MKIAAAESPSGGRPLKGAVDQVSRPEEYLQQTSRLAERRRLYHWYAHDIRKAAGKQLIITAQQHILQQQEEHFPEAGGPFSWLLSGITLATKMIQAKIRQAGSAGHSRERGRNKRPRRDAAETGCLCESSAAALSGFRDIVAILVSEENEEPVTFDRGPELASTSYFSTRWMGRRIST